MRMVERIAELIEREAEFPLCDTCLAARVGGRRTDVQDAIAELQALGRCERASWWCGDCLQRKPIALAAEFAHDQFARRA